jgi:hypothetical protein
MSKENKALKRVLSRQDRLVEGHPGSAAALAPPSTGDGDDEHFSHAMKMIDEVMGLSCAKPNRQTFSDAMIDLAETLSGLSPARRSRPPTGSFVSVPANAVQSPIRRSSGLWEFMVMR